MRSGNDLIAILLLVLAAVLTRMMSANRTTEENNKKISKGNNLLLNSQDQLNELIMLSKGDLVSIDPDQAPHIWDNFYGEYFAINAPWKLEKESTLRYKQLFNIHSKRYKKDGNLENAKYVFFNSCFPHTKEYFSDFMRKIVTETPAAGQKVNIIHIDSDQPPYTIFVGTKRFESDVRPSELNGDKDAGILYAVIYINSQPFTDDLGLPYSAIVSRDQALNKKIMSYAKHLCADGKTSTLDDFLADAENSPND